MEKHEFYICMELHKRLKDKVKGGIFVGIKDHQMKISISGFRGVRFIMFLNDIPDWIDFDKLTEDILVKYKYFLLEKFFTKKGEMTCLLN